MRRVMGGNLPAEMWRDIMLEAHKDREPLALPGTAAVARIAAGESQPPVARTERPEMLPWLAPKQTSTSSPVMRAHPARPRSLVAAGPAQPMAPAARQIAGKPVGQRIFVEPPAAPRLATQSAPSPRLPSTAVGARSHPTDSISADFLARVLEAPSPAKVSPSFAARPSDFDAAEIARRIDAAPVSTARSGDSPAAPSRDQPRGMMSLGAGDE
jgi:membrane peptidoglycan carboxypeptidase